MRAVVEYMPEMRAAAGTCNFSPRFTDAVVHFFDEVPTVNDLKETRPTRTGIELVFRSEQMQAARGTGVDAVTVIVGKLTSIGPLCAFLPQNVECFGCQGLLPRIVRLYDLITIEDVIGHRLAISHRRVRRR